MIRLKVAKNMWKEAQWRECKNGLLYLCFISYVSVVKKIQSGHLREL